MSESGPYQTWVRTYTQRLIDGLRATEILPILYQARHLTLREREDVGLIQREYDRNSKLLDYLRGEDACGCFYEALGTTAQRHLQEGLVHPGSSAQHHLQEGSVHPALEYSAAVYDALTEDMFHTVISEIDDPNMLLRLNAKNRQKIDQMIDRFSLPENRGFRPMERMTRPVNIALVGHTGSGKSATANTIIGDNRFTTSMNAAAATQMINIETITHREQEFRVIDTPGLADPNVSDDKAAFLLSKVTLACPEGVDIFLYVQNVTGYRLTPEGEKVKNDVLRIFGPSILNHMVMVLTHGSDQSFRHLTLTRHLEENVRNTPLQEFVMDQLQGRVTVIENNMLCPYGCNRMRDMLFDVISHTMEQVEYRPYTNQLFEASMDITRNDQRDQIDFAIAGVVNRVMTYEQYAEDGDFNYGDIISHIRTVLPRDIDTELTDDQIRQRTKKQIGILIRALRKLISVVRTIIKGAEKLYAKFCSIS